MRNGLGGYIFLALMIVGALIACGKKNQTLSFDDSVYGVKVFVDNFQGTRAVAWSDTVLRDSAPIKYEDVDITEVRRWWQFVATLPCRDKIVVPKKELIKSVSLIVEFQSHGSRNSVWFITPFGVTLPDGETCLLNPNDRMKIHKAMTFRLNE